MNRVLSTVKALFGGRPPASSQEARRIVISPDPADTVYAVGDIHGEARLLDRLLGLIEADAQARSGRKLLIFLGDYIDRGPDSARVLDILLGPVPKGFERFHLCGNHEEMFLDFLDAPHAGHEWLQHGGIDTLASYGIALEDRRAGRPKLTSLIASHIPDDHLAALRSLPHLITYGDFAFAHAGIRPGVPLDQQSRQDLLWIREGFLDQNGTSGLTVVHGHTPGAAPVTAPGRICVDTGAFASGRLTAVRLHSDQKPEFITAHA